MEIEDRLDEGRAKIDEGVFSQLCEDSLREQAGFTRWILVSDDPAKTLRQLPQLEEAVDDLTISSAT